MSKNFLRHLLLLCTRKCQINDMDLKYVCMYVCKFRSNLIDHCNNFEIIIEMWTKANFKWTSCLYQKVKLALKMHFFLCNCIYISIYMHVQPILKSYIKRNCEAPVKLPCFQRTSSKGWLFPIYMVHHLSYFSFSQLYLFSEY